jgi:hypothetical protein
VKWIVVDRPDSRPVTELSYTNEVCYSVGLQERKGTLLNNSIAAAC